MLKTNKKTILITGGSGTISQHMIPYLKAKGFRVICLTRTKLKDENGGADEYLYGEFSNRDFMLNAFENVNIVIHTAAITRGLFTSAFNENIHITESVLSAAKKSDVETIIHLSSDLASNPVGAYGKSKKECETLVTQCKEIPNRINLQLTSFIAKKEYDSNSTLVQLMSKVFLEKSIVLPNAGIIYLEPIYWHDFLQVIEKIVCDNNIESGTYSINGSKICLKEFLEEYAKEFNKKLNIVSVPKIAINVAISIIDLFTFVSPVVVEFLKKNLFSINKSENNSLLKQFELTSTDLYKNILKYDFKN